MSGFISTEEARSIFDRAKVEARDLAPAAARLLAEIAKEYAQVRKPNNQSRLERTYYRALRNVRPYPSDQDRKAAREAMRRVLEQVYDVRRYTRWP